MSPYSLQAYRTSNLSLNSINWWLSFFVPYNFAMAGSIALSILNKIYFRTASTETNFIVLLTNGLVLSTMFNYISSTNIFNVSCYVSKSSRDIGLRLFLPMQLMGMRGLEQVVKKRLTWTTVPLVSGLPSPTVFVTNV